MVLDHSDVPTSSWEMNCSNATFSTTFSKCTWFSNKQSPGIGEDPMPFLQQCGPDLPVKFLQCRLNPLEHGIPHCSIIPLALGQQTKECQLVFSCQKDLNTHPPRSHSHAKVVPLTILASPWGVILDQSVDSSFTNLKGISNDLFSQALDQCNK